MKLIKAAIKTHKLEYDNNWSHDLGQQAYNVKKIWRYLYFPPFSVTIPTADTFSKMLLSWIILKLKQHCQSHSIIVLSIVGAVYHHNRFVLILNIINQCLYICLVDDISCTYLDYTGCLVYLCVTLKTYNIGTNISSSLHNVLFWTLPKQFMLIQSPKFSRLRIPMARTTRLIDKAILDANTMYYGGWFFFGCWYTSRICIWFAVVMLPF